MSNILDGGYWVSPTVSSNDKLRIDLSSDEG
jgi:hypothetical protein